MEDSAEDSDFSEESYNSSNDGLSGSSNGFPDFLDFESTDDDSDEDEAMRPPRLDPRGLPDYVFRENIGFTKAEVDELIYLFNIQAWAHIFPYPYSSVLDPDPY